MPSATESTQKQQGQKVMLLIVGDIRVPLLSTLIRRHVGFGDHFGAHSDKPQKLACAILIMLFMLQKCSMDWVKYRTVLVVLRASKSSVKLYQLNTPGSTFVSWD